MPNYFTCNSWNEPSSSTPLKGCLYCFLDPVNSYLLIETQLFLNSPCRVSTSSSVLRTDLCLVLINHTYYNKQKWDTSYRALSVVSGIQYTSIIDSYYFYCNTYWWVCKPQSTANSLSQNRHWTSSLHSQGLANERTYECTGSMFSALPTARGNASGKYLKVLGKALAWAFQKIHLRCTSNPGSHSSWFIWCLNPWFLRIVGELLESYSWTETNSRQWCFMGLQLFKLIFLQCLNLSITFEIRKRHFCRRKNFFIY